MGKNKFIDKKKAKTYALVYKSGEPEESDGSVEDGAVQDRVLHEHGSSRKELSDEELEKYRAKQGHPLAWLMEERGLGGSQNSLDEKRRHELIELGFDDDGYDYLQHLRSLESRAKGSSSLEEVVEKKEEEEEEKLVISEKGISVGKQKQPQTSGTGGTGDGVFVKAPVAHVPEEDVALFDASQLTVMQQVDDDKEVTGMMGGVTAFAKKTEKTDKKNYELSEIERMMEEAEKYTDEYERILGDGDLLDDFILTATEMTRGEGEENYEIEEENEEDYSEDSLEYYSDGLSSITDDTLEKSSQVPKRPGSIASTYWREERQDRKNLLSVIDEQFEHLALEYDEDELGDMDDMAEGIRGTADVTEFESILDDFIKDHPKRGDANTVKGKLFLAEEMERHGFSNEYADVAIKMAKEAIRRAEEVEEDPDKPAANAHIEIDPRVFEKEHNKWDCESVLSLRSNIYNHPGTITEPVTKGPMTIKLNKDGLPVEYMPGREFVSTKPSRGDEDFIRLPNPAVPSTRKKDESVEEKKARKSAVKAAKREARANKKEMKVLFAKEKTKASKRDAQAPIQPSIIM